MNLDFKDKVVIITGGGRGIGRAISVNYASSGAHVIVIDNNEKEGRKLAYEINNAGNSVEYVNFDLSNTGRIDQLIRDLSEKYNGLDVLINNARSGDRASPLEETYENIQLTAGVTLFSPMLLSQSFINCIDKTEIKKNRSIVNISSVAAGFAGSESLAYHTAKSGLEGMTRYLAKHGGEKGVRVNAIRPGFIVQDEYIDRYMHDNNTYYRKKAENAHPTGYVGTNNDVAMLALFLSNKASQFITGQIITVDGGLTIQDQWDLSNVSKL